jgi:hypothetical protein
MTSETLKNATRNPGSFRDPDGFIYKTSEGLIRRRVFPSCYPNLNGLMESGLYDELVQANLLIRHNEEDPSPEYRTLTPDVLPFISYPYEWSFQQLKDAALTTLAIQERAMRRGMSLKDASAFNIQFRGHQPLLIDSLSFERLFKDAPWKAYRQFCKNFLGPLLVEARYPILNDLWLSELDGFDLKVASSLLPLKSWFSFGTLMHIHLMAMMEKNPQKAATKNRKKTLKSSLNSQLGLIQALGSLVSKISPRTRTTHWSTYYQENTYSDEDFEKKKNFVLDAVRSSAPKAVWDFGANTGHFSFAVSSLVDSVVALEYDTECVSAMYNRTKAERITNILPIRQNLLNPSPALGWGGAERASLHSRGPCDLGLSLALIHHICLVGNVPLEMIAYEFSRLCRALVIEFVNPDDIRAAQLLERKPMLTNRYTREIFEHAFNVYFDAVRILPLESRQLYYLERKPVPD